MSVTLSVAVCHPPRGCVESTVAVIEGVDAAVVGLDHRSQGTRCKITEEHPTPRCLLRLRARRPPGMVTAVTVIKIW